MKTKTEASAEKRQEQAGAGTELQAARKNETEQTYGRRPPARHENLPATGKPGANLRAQGPGALHSGKTSSTQALRKIERNGKSGRTTVTSAGKNNRENKIWPGPRPAERQLNQKTD